jgi:3-oxoacyl-[acyl-carrier protein] reductase
LQNTVSGEHIMSVVEEYAPASESRANVESFRVLRGKTALVTGASRGLGRVTALALANLGARVAITDVLVDEGRRVVAEIENRDETAGFWQLDVSDEKSVERTTAEIGKRFGPVHVLVNNAGITRDKSFLKMTRDMWDAVLGVNLTGPFNITRAVLPGMIEAGWGRVINIASVVGQTGNFGQANYAVSKGGLIAFTMTLARELARKGITVNAVAPGYIDTEMTKNVPAVTIETVKAMTPMGRLGTPEEVAATIAFLASPQASYITGQVIGVNGGMYM